MSMEQGVSQLTGARSSINNIMYDLVRVPAFPTDHNRELFLFSELDSLLAILDMNEQKRYKESFILIRTIFEKFLFFWLMFEGRMYRHPMTYNVLRQTSKTDKEARFCIGCGQPATKKYSTEGAIIVEKYCDKCAKAIENSSRSNAN